MKMKKLMALVLVLGSATPDVKTFYAARRGVLSLTRLPHRVGGGALPSIELVDISRDAVGAGQGLLAQGGDIPRPVKGDGAGAGGTLIHRQYVLRHGEPSFHFRIFVVHYMMIRIIP